MASLLVAASASPAVAYDAFRNSVLFAAANGKMQPCRRASRTDGYSVASSSGVSSLYRVDRTSGDAELVGVIEDPDLAGLLITAGLSPGANPITRRSFRRVTLSDTERIVDVCGLAAGQGRLIGTATLEKTGIHVVLDIDPNNAQARVIGPLYADDGLLGPTWTELPDATLCHPLDLEYDPIRAQFQTIVSCRYFFNPNGGPGVPSSVFRTMLVYFDIDRDPVAGLALNSLPIDNIVNVTDLQGYDARMNAMMEWSNVPGGNPNEVNQDRLTLALRPSDGTRIGINNVYVLRYTSAGAIDWSRQPIKNQAGALEVLEGQELADFLALNGTMLTYWYFYQSYTSFPAPSEGVFQRTTSTTYDASDPNEYIYRSFFDPGTAESRLGVLGAISGLDDTGVPSVLITDVDSGLNVTGVQAIALADYPDYKDRLANPDGPNFDFMTPCSVTPRNEASCNLATTSTSGSKLEYKKKGGKLYWKTYRGMRLSKSDFGKPTSSDPNTRYALCIYARTGPEGAQHSLISGRQASNPDKWDEKKTGFKYDKGSPSLEISLKAYDRGHARIKLKGAKIEFPELPLNDSGVVLQLQSNDGQCFSSHFRRGSLEKNSSSKVEARSY